MKQLGALYRILAEDTLSFMKKIMGALTGEEDGFYTKVYGGRYEFRVDHPRLSYKSGSLGPLHSGMKADEIVKRLGKFGLKVNKEWDPRTTENPQLYLSTYKKPTMMEGNGHKVVVIERFSDRFNTVLVES